MKRWLTLLALFVVEPVYAEEAEVSFLMAKWPAADSCSPEAYVAVDIQALVKSPRTYDNQCVIVKGYAFQRALFADPDDTAVQYASSDDSVKSGRIGISGSEAVMDKLSQRYDQQYVEVRGRLWQCEDTGLWMGGYCHYTDGPFIGVIEVRSAREPMRYRQD